MSVIKLSVLVTFCNQKDYIKENLDSIVQQNVNFPYEVLICLDKECPESEKIINEYIEKYPYIKLFKVDNSQLQTINIIKASKNRLKLLMEAKGEYFCFLDGDDFYINKNRFQKLVDFLDNHKEYIGVFHDFCTFDHKEQVLKKVIKYGDNECSLDAQTYLKNKIHMSFLNYMFRNIFNGKVPDDLDKDAVNDTSFIYYMLKHGKTFHIPGIMLANRVNIKSIYNDLSDNLQILYILLYAEINHKILPFYEKYICANYKWTLRCCFKFCTSHNIIENFEINLIKNVAKEHDCYFTYNLLNYKNLSLTEKIKLYKNYYLYIKFKKYKTS